MALLLITIKCQISEMLLLLEMLAFIQSTSKLVLEAVLVLEVFASLFSVEVKFASLIL